jgi:hypothetical protein
MITAHVRPAAGLILFTVTVVIKIGNIICLNVQNNVEILKFMFKICENTCFDLL